MSEEVRTFREQDKLLRAGVRENLSSWLKKLNCGGDEELKLEYKMKMVQKLRSSSVAVEVDKANEQHYEVPTEFFKKILGKRLKYSSCLYTEDTKTLDQAEERMLELVCKRAKVEDGQTIMDLGCGWGSLALWICEKYPNCKVLCVSNSKTQQQHIEREAKLKSYNSRLNSLTADANVFTTSMKFDRIISIEMFEHMKNYETLISRVSSWLKPHGLLFVHVLCHCKYAYEFKTKGGSDTEWMARNFFSGGTMPSSDLFLYFQRDMYTIDHWQVNGKNYTKTIDAWLDKLYDNLDQVKAILAASYGDNNVNQHLFNWRMFLLYCSETFGFNNGNDWLLSQMLFKKHLSSTL